MHHRVRQRGGCRLVHHPMVVEVRRPVLGRTARFLKKGRFAQVRAPPGAEEFQVAVVVAESSGGGDGRWKDG